MFSVLAVFDFQQINSGVYFAAATVLIFTAAVLAGRRVKQQLPLKWLVGIAGLAFLTLALIWLLISALNRKEATPPSPPPDYPAATGSP
jgi:putative Ca2+/H+ antiporter (TMEM165/GDT1 family)